MRWKSQWTYSRRPWILFVVIRIPYTSILQPSKIYCAFRDWYGAPLLNDRFPFPIIGNIIVTILFPRANHLPLFQHGQCPSRSGTFQKHAFACFFLLASIYYLHAFYAMLTIPIPRLLHHAQRPYPMPIPHYLHLDSSYELHAHSALFTYTYHMFSHTSTMLSLSI